MKKRQIIVLGDLEVDLGARCVSRDGAEIALSRLSFDLLQALIEAAPVALSNDEIVARVWSAHAVSDENIKQRVSLLRRALGQSAELPYVETLRGFGYRLGVEPRRRESPTAAAARAGAGSERLPRVLLLVLAIISFILLITVLAIAARQLKRMELSSSATAITQADPKPGRRQPQPPGAEYRRRSFSEPPSRLASNNSASRAA